MTGDPFRVLLAGFGGIGTQRHQTDMYLPAFQSHPGFLVAGAVDLPGAEGAAGVDATWYDDYAAALADSAFDVVCVVAPLEQRADLVGQAIRAGKHVLGDKPLAATAAEAAELGRLAEEQGIVLVPAHHQRLQAMVRSAEAALRSGRIGLPWNVQADFFVAGGEPAPVGELINLGLYPIDIVLSLVGLGVRRVFARGASYWNGAVGDFALLMLDHANGVTSTIACGHTGSLRDIRPGGVGVHRYRISGSHGVLITDVTKPALAVHTAAARSSRWTGTDTVRALLDVLHNGISTRRPQVGPADAVAVQAVVEAAQESQRTGRPVLLSCDEGVGRP